MPSNLYSWSRKLTLSGCHRWCWVHSWSRYLVQTSWHSLCSLPCWRGNFLHLGGHRQHYRVGSNTSRAAVSKTLTPNLKGNHWIFQKLNGIVVLTWNRDLILGWKTREWFRRRDSSSGCEYAASLVISPVSCRFRYKLLVIMFSSWRRSKSRNGPKIFIEVFCWFVIGKF